MNQRPLLIVGLPRSGTTWTANILATAPRSRLVSEPDNEKLSAPAINAKRQLGRFPALDRHDRAQDYSLLWKWAFAAAPQSSATRSAAKLVGHSTRDQQEELVQGRPPRSLRLAGMLASRPPATPLPGRAIVKSVHAGLSVEWIAENFDIDVLVLLRHPANVLSSWIELDLPDRNRSLFEREEVQERYIRRWGLPVPRNDLVEAAGWQIGLLTAALEESSERNPRWTVTTHEHLCTDPPARFKELFGALDLEWGDDSGALIDSSNRAGSGFSTEREVSGLADKWRKQLSAQQIRTLAEVLEPFPIRRWDLSDLA